MMRPERVYIIRHGQTDWNANGRWQGITPVGLNDVGHEQARKLAAYLAHQPIEAVYCSDLPRAFDTAKALADVHKLTPTVDERWRELHVGIFQGLTRAEITLRYAAEFAAMHDDWLDYVIPEGESRRQLQERAFAAWQNAVENMSAGQVAIVSHGGTIKLLLMRLFAAQAEKLDKQELANTSLTILQRIPDGWEIAALATVTHLEEAIQAEAAEESAQEENRPQTYF